MIFPIITGGDGAWLLIDEVQAWFGIFIGQSMPILKQQLMDIFNESFIDCPGTMFCKDF